MSRRSSRTPTPVSTPISPENPATTPESCTKSKWCCKKCWRNFFNRPGLLKKIGYIVLVIAIICLMIIICNTQFKATISFEKEPVNGTNGTTIDQNTTLLTGDNIPENNTNIPPENQTKIT